MFVMSYEGHLLSGTACVNENIFYVICVCVNETYFLCHMEAVCFQVRPVSMKNVCLLCQMKAICFQVRPVSMEMYICYVI